MAFGRLVAALLAAGAAGPWAVAAARVGSRGAAARTGSESLEASSLGLHSATGHRSAQGAARAASRAAQPAAVAQSTAAALAAVAGQPAGAAPVDPALARFAVPPPLPQIAPWADGQPADVALGNLVVSRLTDGPTRTPLPTQGSIDIAAACPVLEDWPSSVEITVPDPCQHTIAGHWASPGGILGGGEPLMSWQLNCWLQAPTVAFDVPSGDFFGSSKTAGVLIDDTFTLHDCRGNPKYSIQESVFHAPGLASPQICEKYGSCDGTVWLQYAIYDYTDGRKVAKTPFLQLFQDSFDVQDQGGTTIATVSRAGGWNPVTGECGETRKWVVDYADRGGKGTFSTPTDQWPIAEMVTMMAVRDANRRPSGLLAPTSCELKGYVLELVLGFLLAAAIGSVVVLFLRTGVEPCRDFMVELEDRVCPKRMRVPAKFESR